MTPNLLDELEKLRLPHNVCEDGWYSCPKSGDCLNDGQGDDCNCGADSHNARLDSIKAALADMAKRMEAAERDAARYRWLRVRLAGAAHVNELEEYNQTMHSGLASDVDAAIDATQEGEAG